MDNVRIYPLPEILDDGRDWRIRGDKRRIGVDYKERLITVPLDDDPVSHCLKIQQIARIKWNDRRVPSEDTLLFKAVEDHRLSFLLDEAGLDIDAGFFTDEIIETIQESGDAGILAMLLMSDYTERAPTERFIKQNREEKLVDMFVHVQQSIRETPTKANVAKLVEWLRKQITDVNQPALGPRMGRDGKHRGGEDAFASDMMFDDFYELAWEECGEDMKLQELPSDVREELPSDLPESIKTHIKHWKVSRVSTFVPWGTATIEEPHRSIAATGKFMRKWKATDEGVFPRYPHRYAVDQRVFARRIKRPGGTVIIDSSGSMGLTPEAIKLMVEHAPGCVVANYSGSGNRGVIRILAKDGKRVADQYCTSPYGGGNIVDYHGLRWAYRLAHPRIWISDLGVSGVGDAQGTGNLAMCAAVAKKGKFFHGTDVAEAIKIFKRLGRFYKQS